MLDVGDLVNSKIDVDAGVEGRLRAMDVEGCTEVVVTLDNNC